MTPEEITRQLEGVADTGDDFPAKSNNLAESWLAARVGSEAVEPILRFMEEHPEIDYGTPGALVHFVECFGKKDYDDKLLVSVERKPVTHTVWMLNRIINAAESPQELESLVAVMQRVTLNPRADAETVQSATEFLESLAESSQNTQKPRPRNTLFPIQKLTKTQKIGLCVFVLLCIIPALEMYGFGLGIPFTFPAALACASVGGAIGGLLFCPRPPLAGLIGGLLAGLGGLVAIYFYTQHRESVSHVELAVVQCMASLPGYLAGAWLKKALSRDPEGSHPGAVPNRAG